MTVRSDGRVSLGRLGAPHGIKGWVKLHSHTQPKENILEYRQFYTPSGERLEIDEIRVHGKGFIAHVVGYDTPEMSRALTGLDLSVDCDSLPALENGEYYWHELVGLIVTTIDGEELGRVGQMIETGANDVLVVVSTDSSIDDRERLIPYLPDRVVRQVNVQAGTLLVDWQTDW